MDHSEKPFVQPSIWELLRELEEADRKRESEPPKAKDSLNPDEPPVIDISEYKITDEYDWQLMLYAKNVILQDNGEEDLPAHINKILDAYYEKEPDEGDFFTLWMNMDVTQYYMIKAGRWAEFAKWENIRQGN